MTDTPLSQEDFEAIEAAVLETARGRWFLGEYARRQRAAEMAEILDAIRQLDAKVTASPPPAAADTPLDAETILKTVRQAQSDLATALGVHRSNAPEASLKTGVSRAKAAEQAALGLRELEHHLAAVAEEAAPDIPPAISAMEDVADVPPPGIPETVATLPQGDDEPAALENELFGDAPLTAVVARKASAQPDNHDALATTLRAAIARVRGPSSEIDTLSFEGKSVLFA